MQTADSGRYHITDLFLFLSVFIDMLCICSYKHTYTQMIPDLENGSGRLLALKQ